MSPADLVKCAARAEASGMSLALIFDHFLHGLTARDRAPSCGLRWGIPLARSCSGLEQGYLCDHRHRCPRSGDMPH